MSAGIVVLSSNWCSATEDLQVVQVCVGFGSASKDWQLGDHYCYCFIFLF